jgi:hypothetical protein
VRIEKIKRHSAPDVAGRKRSILWNAQRRLESEHQLFKRAGAQGIGDVAVHTGSVDVRENMLYNADSCVNPAIMSK